MMRNLFFILAAALFFACQDDISSELQQPVEDHTEKPNEPDEEPDKPIVEDGPAVFTGARMGTWHKMDEIAVVGSGKKIYTGQNSTSNTSRASFPMEGLTVKGGSILELQDKDCPWYTVIFPKSAVSKAETAGHGDVLKGVTLPERQSLLGYHDINILYAALTNGGENSGFGGDYNGNALEFNSACAGLTIKLQGKKSIKSIEIKAPDGTNITGTGSFSCYEGGWYFGCSDMLPDSPEGSFDGSSKVVLEADEPVELAEDKYTAFNACVIPAKTYLSDKSGKPETLRSNTVGGAVAGEYTITITDSDGKTITKTHTLTEDTAAGKSASLGSFELGKATVETVSVAASAMERNVEVVYIVPETASKDSRCPVLYLLHGYSDTHNTWLSYNPNLQEISNEKGLIIACPFGNNSWYWDSPVKSDFRYETFIYKDLVEYTDAHYPTIAKREARAITGNSMGGHGAMWNAIRHQDVFGAVGAMSGGVDIRPFPDNWDMKTLIGSKAEYPERWDDYTVINQLDKLQDGSLAIIFDCGKSDFFYEVNNNLDTKMTELGIKHTYDGLRSGGHNWDYWAISIVTQIDFFMQYFNKN